MGTYEFTNNAEGNTDEKFYGGDGDDTIWGGSNPVGPVFYKGGAGDDKIYGAYKVTGPSPANVATNTQTI